MSLKADIEKNFGSFRLKLNIEAENETLALLGASGCGKSLSLKCIAGVIKPDRGHIELNGRTLFDSARGINLSPQQRRTGLMFQNYALFPNMSLRENIKAGAKREKNPKLRDKKVTEIMERFGLSELGERMPSQLSGGQQQRTALARILVSQPEILLLDEPFSALDSHLRFRLEGELRSVIREFGKTVILVSHDRDEVYRLSDKIAVMNGGTVETQGSRDRVFAQPETRTAAILTGCRNISSLRRLSRGEILAEDWGIRLKAPENGETPAFAGIRASELKAGQGEDGHPFRILEQVENPFSVTLILAPEGSVGAGRVELEMSREERQKIQGDRVQLRFPQEKILFLKE